VYQPDIYREAARKAGIKVPDTDTKQEGIHSQCWQLDDGGIELGADEFMDKRVFDPDELDDYVDSFEIKKIINSNSSITGQAV
jgi:hypothetical protein